MYVEIVVSVSASMGGMELGKESRIMRVMLISYTQKGWMEKKKHEMQDIPSRLEGDVSEGY